MQSSTPTVASLNSVFIPLCHSSMAIVTYLSYIFNLVLTKYILATYEHMNWWYVYCYNESTMHECIHM